MLRGRTARFHYDKGAVMKVYYEKDADLNTLKDKVVAIIGYGNMKKMSSRAVGGAVGWNPIGIIIPCHRVVGANGALTGYGGGMKNKIALLALERKY